ncbi:ATPase [Vallitalea guaymasensis]|uniref:ATPase n=1 Tax=Vallitalea guaymasensis TaxID=1185412 RepID=UPI00272985CA|nr:ATPase [Vallitalea guaymasensis]
MDVNAAVGKLFKRAYRYLAAAKNLYTDIELIHQDAVNKAGVYIEAQKIISKILGNINVSKKIGRVRKLFASAITPKGFVNHLDSVVGCNDKIYRIIGEPGTNTSKLLELIMEDATKKGLDVEAFYCPIDPENKIEHLVIKKLGVAFITTNDFHDLKVVNSQIIDMNKYIDYTILNQYFDVLQYDYRVFRELVETAITTIHDAKKSHDYLETLYIPHMDFDKVKQSEDKTLERILKYAEELNV